MAICVCETEYFSLSVWLFFPCETTHVRVQKIDSPYTYNKSDTNNIYGLLSKRSSGGGGTCRVASGSRGWA